MNSKKLNIAFGKIGKSILFCKHNWGMIGGDHEAPGSLIALAQMNPNINFYIIGKSDWKKLNPEYKKLYNCNNNIFDIYETFNAKKTDIPVYEWPIIYFKQNNIKIDFGFIINGPCGNANCANKIYTIDKQKYAKVLFMFNNYAGPIINFLNISQIPWIEIGEDPTYFLTKARDLYNRPTKILTTKNIKNGVHGKMVQGYYEDSKKIIEYNQDISFGDISKMFLASEPDVRLKTINKRTNLLSVYSNGLKTSKGKIKFPEIKKYVLDNFETSTIYGTWDYTLEGINKYKDRIHEIPMMELQEQMYNTKYAFMIPIRAHWSTSKYYKHLLFGIIPFLHPTSECAEMPVPEFTILKSPKDFKEKINFLENNPDEYIKLWKECQLFLKDEDFDGSRFNNLFLNEIKENCDTNGVDLITMPIKYNLSCLFKDDIILHKSLF